MDQGFDRVDKDIRAMRIELSGRIDAQGSRFDAIETRIDAMQETLHGVQRTMIQVGGGIIAAFLVTLVTVIATRG